MKIEKKLNVIIAAASGGVINWPKVGPVGSESIVIPPGGMEQYIYSTIERITSTMVGDSNTIVHGSTIEMSSIYNDVMIVVVTLPPEIGCYPVPLLDFDRCLQYADMYHLSKLTRSPFGNLVSKSTPGRKTLPNIINMECNKVPPSEPVTKAKVPCVVVSLRGHALISNGNITEDIPGKYLAGYIEHDDDEVIFNSNVLNKLSRDFNIPMSYVRGIMRFLGDKSAGIPEVVLVIARNGISDRNFDIMEVNGMLDSCFPKGVVRTRVRHVIEESMLTEHRKLGFTLINSRPIDAGLYINTDRSLPNNK